MNIKGTLGTVSLNSEADDKQTQCDKENWSYELLTQQKIEANQTYFERIPTFSNAHKEVIESN